jgi:hypothetical protein
VNDRPPYVSMAEIREFARSLQAYGWRPAEALGIVRTLIGEAGGSARHLFDRLAPRPRRRTLVRSSW